MISQTACFRAENSMREIIRDNNLLLMTISRFGIPFGFGDDSIGKICADNNVDVDTFLSVCNLLSGRSYDVNGISLPSLMNYLRQAHASFIDVLLPRIRRSMIEGIVHSDTDEIALMLMKFFDDYVVEVRKHMEHENDVIFSYAENLLEGKLDKNFTIGAYSGTHDHTVAKLNELKDLFIYHFKQRDNIKLSVALFDIIVCEKDMMSHFEVESKLFVPAVERLEKSVIVASNPNGEKSETVETDTSDSLVVRLSDREKDIIRCVARGLSNKEIAEELFISSHTVATHRRNISSKLEIHSPGGLIIFALLHKLIDLSEIKQ